MQFHSSKHRLNHKNGLENETSLLALIFRLIVAKSFLMCRHVSMPNLLIAFSTRFRRTTMHFSHVHIEKISGGAYFTAVFTIVHKRIHVKSHQNVYQNVEKHSIFGLHPLQNPFLLCYISARIFPSFLRSQKINKNSLPV